jgi:hypothetical protein
LEREVDERQTELDLRAAQANEVFEQLRVRFEGERSRADGFKEQAGVWRGLALDCIDRSPSGDSAAQEVRKGAVALDLSDASTEDLIERGIARMHERVRATRGRRAGSSSSSDGDGEGEPERGSDGEDEDEDWEAMFGSG